MSGKSQWTMGIHAVTALLRCRPDSVIQVYTQQGREDARLEEIRALCLKLGVPLQQLPRRQMDRQYPGVHQGVAAHHGDVQSAAPRRGGRTSGGEQELAALLAGLHHEPLLLVLDGVTDPHNLGACLRSADAAGAHGVIIPKDRAAPLNAAARKAASGAAENVPLLRVSNLARSLKTLKQQGLWLAGAAEDGGNSLYGQDLRGPLALVFGSEGGGLRRLTRQHCDFLLSIPMAGSVPSLNVSVAAAVCLFEAVRQRTAAPLAQRGDFSL